MQDHEIRHLIDEVANKAAAAAVKQTLVTMGIDADNPFEVQKDMQYLREWRESISAVKRHGLDAAIGFIILGALAMVWAAIKNPV